MATETTTKVKWNLKGDYFENCNCDMLCPCLFAPTGPLTASPTEGFCDVALAIHVENGKYGNVSLNGLNVFMFMHSPEAMGKGNMSVALYIDERANAQQREGLQAIFSGAAGGPVSAFSPLISKLLGVKYVPITFTKEGKKRSVSVTNIAKMAVQGLPSMKPDGSEMWAATGHPFNAEKLALANSDKGSTFNDYGFRLDSSGKNGHYASLNWSN